ncbi:unnamed protein product, partial [Didymodactylos carnosus]
IKGGIKNLPYLHPKDIAATLREFDLNHVGTVIPKTEDETNIDLSDSCFPDDFKDISLVDNNFTQLLQEIPRDLLADMNGQCAGNDSFGATSGEDQIIE